MPRLNNTPSVGECRIWWVSASVGTWRAMSDCSAGNTGRCLLRRGTPRSYKSPVKGRRFTQAWQSLHSSGNG
ncbi:MAG: hypothetical protein HDR84_05050 [Bacteroides sp.]|nr:hypothetical protein [Bacteroides sp.]